MSLLWKDVDCPRCGEKAGNQCRSASGQLTYAHAARHRLGLDRLLRPHPELQLRLRPIRTVHLPP